jgi:hypothetical protein
MDYLLICPIENGTPYPYPSVCVRILIDAPGRHYSSLSRIQIDFIRPVLIWAKPGLPGISVFPFSPLNFENIYNSFPLLNIPHQQRRVKHRGAKPLKRYGIWALFNCIHNQASYCPGNHQARKDHFKNLHE